MLTKREMRKLHKWLDSPEGQKALVELPKKFDRTKKLLEDAARVDWRMLQEPMTI